MKKIKIPGRIVFYIIFVVLGAFLFCFSYFSTAGVCKRIDAKVTGYDKKHFTLNTAANDSSDKKSQKIQIIRATLPKNLDKFLKMNVGNLVNECFTANSIKKE